MKQDPVDYHQDHCLVSRPRVLKGPIPTHGAYLASIYWDSLILLAPLSSRFVLRCCLPITFLPSEDEEERRGRSSLRPQLWERMLDPQEIAEKPISNTKMHEFKSVTADYITPLSLVTLFGSQYKKRFNMYCDQNIIRLGDVNIFYCSVSERSLLIW